MYNFMPTVMVIILPFLFQENYSLIFLWIILELSSIMFICMFLLDEESKKKEYFLMYFLIQSFASAFLLICLFSWSNLLKMMNLENNNNISLLVSVLIAMKIAMSPFHFWLIKMSKSISWSTMGTLLTWQKIIPLCFFSSMSMNVLLSSMAILTLLVGSLSQMKLTSVKMLISFSSISHLGWMVYPILKCSMISIMYLLFYSLITLSLILTFFYSNYLYLFNQMGYKMSMYLTMLILSLSGIPPLVGFLLKWMSLSCMLSSISIMMIFCLMACLSFYIYIRIIYKSLMMTPFSIKQNNVSMNLKLLWKMNLILPILPLMI